MDSALTIHQRGGVSVADVLADCGLGPEHAERLEAMISAAQPKRPSRNDASTGKAVISSRLQISGGNNGTSSKPASSGKAAS